MITVIKPLRVFLLGAAQKVKNCQAEPVEAWHLIEKSNILIPSFTLKLPSRLPRDNLWNSKSFDFVVSDCLNFARNDDVATVFPNNYVATKYRRNIGVLDTGLYKKLKIVSLNIMSASGKIISLCS